MKRTKEQSHKQWIAACRARKRAFQKLVAQRYTMAAIGKMHGISRERVRQILVDK